MIYYRIPSGRYGVEWKDSPTFGRVLKLKNEFVHSDRNIFIHNGNTPKDSNGCLLINQADNNKENTLFNSKIAKEHFTNTLQSNNSIRKYFNNIDKDKMIKQIEVRIENGFRIERKSNKISVEIARLKAFMYALRYGEGTLGAEGYKTIVGGGTFDDFSKHPNVYNKKLNSTAAGAYQFLSTTWNRIVSQYGKEYNIDDFSPKNQDKACLVLLHKTRESINLIMDNKIDEAIRSRTDKPKKRLHYEWASLPDSPYGQRTEKMEYFMRYYNKHLEEELQGISNLAMSNEDFAEFLQLLRNQK